MPETTSRILTALKDVLGPPENPICLHEPDFKGREWDYVKECIDTGWVSSAGSYVDLFEEKLAATCGTKHAILTVNGTAALHIALLLAGIKTGDHVIMPSLTFIATANAVKYCGAVPHFVDVDENTLAICPDKLEAYLAKTDISKIKAILPVHIFGHPADMDALQAVADKYGLPLIADAAEALGSE
jgi:perosamine synthetase